MTKTDSVAWSLVGISFIGGVYICWVFGAYLVSPLTHFIIALF